jgi:hypothetical protein
MSGKENIKIVRFSAWIYVFFLGGMLAVIVNSISAIKDDDVIPVNRFLRLALYFVVVLLVLSIKIVLTPSGHYGIFGIVWRGKIVKLLFRTPMRMWRDCLIHLEFGWPFYPLNIRETPGHFPLIVKYLTADYRKCCLYLYDNAKAARIDFKTKEYLKGIFAKHKS